MLEDALDNGGSGAFWDQDRQEWVAVSDGNEVGYASTKQQAEDLLAKAEIEAMLC